MNMSINGIFSFDSVCLIVDHSFESKEEFYAKIRTALEADVDKAQLANDFVPICFF